jgi:archaellum biogenesis ATPase FlaH
MGGWMLTDDDKTTLAKLTTEQGEQDQVKYAFSEEFLRMLIGLMLSDKFFLSQSLGLIKPNYFANETHQLVCRLVTDHFEEYRQMPSKIFMRQLVEDALRNKHQNQDNETFQTVKLVHLGELNTIYDYYSRGGVGDMMPGLDAPDAILDKITAFAKTQAIKTAFHESLAIIRKNPEADDTWMQVDQLYKEARLVERKIDLGLNYFETIEERYKRMAKVIETADFFVTGFDVTDRALGGGLFRGEIGAWMGLSGRGKSIGLVVTCVKNLARGRKVLYISTEMDCDRIASRFDSQISLVGSHQLLTRQDEVFRALSDEVKDYDDKRRLVIKQFPSGTADMNTIRAFHAQGIMYGFRPDLVILDYPGDMKHPPHMKKYESIQRMVTELRGFGSEEGFCSFIAIQANRGATELGVDDYIDSGNMAGSFDQNTVLDFSMTINQTDAEKKAAVGRIFVDKARNGESKFSFKVRYGFPTRTLTMDVISEQTYRKMMNEVTTSAATSVEDKIDKIIIGDKEGWKPSDDVETTA